MATHEDVVLDVDGLRMRYGTKDVLHDVTFRARRGEVVALLGPNGAGKTTALEILEGFRMRSAGQDSVLGTEPVHGDERWHRPRGRHRHQGPAGPRAPRRASAHRPGRSSRRPGRRRKTRPTRSPPGRTPDRRRSGSRTCRHAGTAATRMPARRSWWRSPETDPRRPPGSDVEHPTARLRQGRCDQPRHRLLTRYAKDW
jgi:energy-coupling factor transporter ATP-binding protein EcfA2